MNEPLATIRTTEYTAELNRTTGLVHYRDHDCSADVRLYTGYFIIENRGRRYARRFDQLTGATEGRLRAIAKRIRPDVRKRNSTKMNKRSGRTSSRRRLSAAAGLAIIQGRALGELVERANGDGEQR